MNALEEGPQTTEPPPRSLGNAAVRFTVHRPGKPTVSAESEPSKPEPSLVALAAKARLLERLVGGDERVLAAELARELEALAGPVAEVRTLRGRS